MHLVIRAVSLDDQPLAEPLVGIFDGRGGTIGRSEANTLALVDPHRRISRLQAEISARGDRCFVRNAGSAADIVVGSLTLAPGAEALVADGDELVIGGYRLLVHLQDASDGPRAGGRHVAVDKRHVPISAEPKTDPGWIATPNLAARSSGVGPRPTAPSDRIDVDPFADILGASGTASAADPFADLMAGSASGLSQPSPAAAPDHDDPFAFLAASSAPPRARPAASAAATMRPFEPGPGTIPDDFDLFAQPAPTPSSRPPAAFHSMTSVSDSDASLLSSVGAGSGRRSSLDEVFGLSAAASGSDPLAAFLGGTPSGSPSSSGSAKPAASASLDPLAMFSAPTSQVPVQRQSGSNHVAELQGAYKPPRILGSASEGAGRPAAAHPAPRRPDAATLPSPHAPSAPTGGPPPDALWAAFCEGAGVHVALPQGLTTEQMRIVGELVAASVSGLMPLARSASAASGSAPPRSGASPVPAMNPLALAADLAIAFDLLLLPPRRGFMTGPEAIRETLRFAARRPEPPARKPQSNR